MFANYRITHQIVLQIDPRDWAGEEPVHEDEWNPVGAVGFHRKKTRFFEQLLASVKRSK
jgi:hypothetical protein